MAKIQYNDTHFNSGVTRSLKSKINGFVLSLWMLLTIALYNNGLTKDAAPKKKLASTELKAKCCSPPEWRSNGLITTCSIAMPMPIENREIKATWNVGTIANNKAATVARTNPAINTVFSEYFSIKIPDGIDITPYATKKEKGRKPASPILKSKLSMMSGTNGPRMLVRKEMTAKIRNISRTINVLCFIRRMLSVIH